MLRRNLPASRSVSLLLGSLSIYYLTSLVVFVGAIFGTDFVRPNDANITNNTTGKYLKGLVGFDGYWYAEIAAAGYSYDVTKRSNANFFPAYPMVGFFVSRLTGVAETIALIITSNIFLCSAFVLFAYYLRDDESRQQCSDWALLAFGVWPATFFFRLAYSEAMFVFFAILSLYAMQRKWPTPVIAIIAGASTGCRPLGVALCPAFIWYLVEQRRSTHSVLLQLGIWCPIALWGLIAFCCYQFFAFGDAFVYVKSQEAWAPRHDPWLWRMWQSVILEPIWSKYLPNSPAWWARNDSVANPVFSLDFANPVYFITTLVIIVYGWYRKVLNIRESLYAICLLLLSYFAQGHRFMMASQGRFAATAFPVYIVMGYGLARMPPFVACLLLAGSGIIMAAYAALSAAKYAFF